MAELVYPPVIGAAHGLFRALDIRIDMKGTENIPRKGGAVLVSNHIGYLDFIFAARRRGRRSAWSVSWPRSRCSGTRCPVR